MSVVVCGRGVEKVSWEHFGFGVGCGFVTVIWGVRGGNTDQAKIMDAGCET